MISRKNGYYFFLIFEIGKKIIWKFWRKMTVEKMIKSSFHLPIIQFCTFYFKVDLVLIGDVQKKKELGNALFQEED